jgi:hypothetical protein|tara:strand:- start:1759 stop:2232 length:474 start_codon:yes stop_codon:yes gene_type:complete
MKLREVIKEDNFGKKDYSLEEQYEYTPLLYYIGLARKKVIWRAVELPFYINTANDQHELELKTMSFESEYQFNKYVKIVKDWKAKVPVHFQERVFHPIFRRHHNNRGTIIATWALEGSGYRHSSWEYGFKIFDNIEDGWEYVSKLSNTFKIISKKEL